MAQPAIQLKGVSHQYQPDQPVLQDVSFAIAEGQFVSLLGPNGSGKTTIFRILSTLLLPLHGEAFIHDFSIREAAREVRRRLGVVFQSPALDGRLTVQENLITHGMLYGMNKSEIMARIAHIGAGFDVMERLASRTDTLSGGLLRQADLIRGLLHQPSILMLDEPTSGLDPGVRKNFWSLLRQIRKSEPLTVLLTTHLLDEADTSDEVLILNKGTLVAQGSPDTLKDALGDQSVWISSHASESLFQILIERFQLRPERVGGLLRIEDATALKQINAIYQDAGSMIESITIRKPDLDDVFLLHTGSRLEQDLEGLSGGGDHP